jgi:tight adherence protein B
MLSWAALAGGLALLCWPRSSPGSRLATLLQGAPTHRTSPWTPPRFLFPLLLCTAAAAAVPVLGPGAVVAAALLVLAVRLHRNARVRARAQVSAVSELAEAVRAVVAGLRAGAHPATVADSVAVDAAPQPRQVLRELAATARLGVGPETVALPTGEDPVTGQAVRRLQRAWSLAQRHGLPLAEVLDSVRRDLDATARFTGQTDARMAGPRASAAVLALLPMSGLLLGEAMGARPGRVLLTTTPGQVLLVLGAALIFAGVAWTVRLTRQVMVS